MKPIAAAARAGSAVALLALSGCFYVGPGYYPYGYYVAVPLNTTLGHGLANGADAQNIPPAAQGAATYAVPVPMYAPPAYHPPYYAPSPWYGWP